MQPASNDTIEATTSLLFGYIQDENSDEDEAVHSNHDACDYELDVLDRRLNAMELTFAAVQQSMMRRIAQARQIRNLHLPISALPVELMADIFKLATADGLITRPQAGIHNDRLSYSRLQSLHQLSRTSSRWRTIIVNAPPLWTSISANNPFQLISKALTRSAALPLDVELESGPSMYYLLRCLRLSAAHINRWRTLKLNAQIDGLQKYLERPAPVLTRVELSQRWHGRLLRLDAPRLTDVHLHSIKIEWAGLTGLRSLSLRSIREDSLPSIGQALRWLSTSPEMDMLSLVRVQFSPNLLLDDPTSIDLPRLSQLILSEIGYSASREIIKRARAPALRQFHLNVDLQGRPVNSVFNGATSHLNAILVSLGNEAHLELKLDAHRLRLEGEAVNIILENTSPYDLFTPSQENGITIFSVIPITSMRLDEGFELTRQPFVPSLFHPSTRIQAITIDTNFGVPEFLTELSAPSICDNGVSQWMLPELRTIRFKKFAAELGHIIQMMQSRYGEARPNGLHNLPVPLDEVVLPYDLVWADPEVEQFKKLVAPLVGRIELFSPSFFKERLTPSPPSSTLE